MVQRSWRGFLFTCPITKEAQTLTETSTALKQRGFETKAIDAACAGVIFLGVESPEECDVVTAAQELMESWEATHAQRLVPVLASGSAAAAPSDLAEAVARVLTASVVGDAETFGCEVRITNAAREDKKDIIDAVARVQALQKLKVDLSKPDLTVIVWMIKSAYLIGACRRIKELYNYNLQYLLLESRLT